MSDDSKIEWTDATWNPIRGCSRVSAGCARCYAERVAARFSGPGLPYEGLVRIGAAGKPTGWNGTVRMAPEHLAAPLRWRRPRRVFVNSMSDLFHESLPDSAIDRVFAVMMVSSLHATRGGHTFQSLTKRAKRMREYLTDPGTQERVARAAGTMMEDGDGWFDAIAFRKEGLAHPLIWLGVSVENQAAADERIPELLRTPAAVRWISAEPLLGEVDLDAYIHEPMRCVACGALDVGYDTNPHNLTPLRDGNGQPIRCAMGVEMTGEPGAERCNKCQSLDVEHLPRLSWVVSGCESGPGARPCDVAWLRKMRDQLDAAGVPWFLKQAVEGGDTPIVTTNGERFRPSSLSRSTQTKCAGRGGFCRRLRSTQT
jgi:protein gp37